MADTGNDCNATGTDRGTYRAVCKPLAAIVHQQIFVGDLGPGVRVPSELDMRREYHVGQEAVRHPTAIVRQEGLASSDHDSQPRHPIQRTQLPLGCGDWAIVRMPTEPESRHHNIDKGAPVLEIHRTDGTTELHPANTTELVFRGT